MSLLAIVHIIVLLALAAWSVGLGVSLAIRPSQRRHELLRPVSWGTVFASVSGVLSGLGAVTVRLAEPSSSVPAAEVVRHAWAGVSEALVPGMFGFGLLAVAWGLAAIGLRKLE
jgi:hypothetical protein